GSSRRSSCSDARDQASVAADVQDPTGDLFARLREALRRYTRETSACAVTAAQVNATARCVEPRVPLLWLPISEWTRKRSAAHARSFCLFRVDHLGTGGTPDPAGVESGRDRHP